MNRQQIMKIVRTAHRLTGLLLIPLVLLKLLTGFNMVGKLDLLIYEKASSIHLGAYIDIPLLFCFIFHGSLGILRMLLPGLKHKERGIFISLGMAALLSVSALVFLYLL